MDAIKYELQPYSEGFYEFVYDAKKIAYQEYVEHYYVEWNEQKQLAMFNDYIEKTQKNIKIIKIDGKNAGFVEGIAKNKDDYDLGNICIMPEFRGKGIGTNILNAIIGKYKNISLRVFKINPARNLYKRLGFEIFDETPTHFYMKKCK